MNSVEDLPVGESSIEPPRDPTPVDASTSSTHDNPLLSASNVPSPSQTTAAAVNISNMLDASDFRMMEPSYHHNLNGHGRMSPSYNPGNYTTLTTLQPLPPISTVAPISSEHKWPVNTPSQGVSGSFTLMQNSFNNSLPMGMNTYHHQYDKLNMTAGLASPTHPSMPTMGPGMASMISGMGGMSNGLGTQTQSIGSPYAYNHNGLASPKSPGNSYESYNTIQRDMGRGLQSHHAQSDSLQLHSAPSVMTTMNGLHQTQPQLVPTTSVTPLATTTVPTLSRERCAPLMGSPQSVKSGEVEEINTKELAQRISAELKRYSIPQAIFAQRVLCRSQGTLSDLLRNPKPWSKLKSGRETFRRMYKWLEEPEFQRMSSLRLAGMILSDLLTVVEPTLLPSSVKIKRLSFEGWLKNVIFS